MCNFKPMLPNGFLFTTPLDIFVAFFVAVLVGLSKGGLGGTMAILGVAVLSLIIPPVQAAGILLPLLLVMDFIGLAAWWGRWDLRMVGVMLPGAIVGVAVGWLTAALVSDAVVRLVIAGIALGYLVSYVVARRRATITPRPQHTGRATFWAFLAGYGSFVAHSGGPAYQVYAMPLRAAPAIFTGTSTLFFTLVNIAKLVPYTALGQFDTTNLVTSATLMPVAAVSTLAGAAIVRRMRAEVFYPLMHALLLILALKLLWDGLHGL